jgi:response regulator of citrate/malate metabolism
MKISKEELTHLKYSRKLTHDEIGHIFSIPKHSVEYMMRKYGIQRKYTTNIPEDTLIKLYVDEKKSIQEVSQIMNVSRYKIRKSLEQQGIKIRSRWDQVFINDLKRRKEKHLPTYKIRG